MAFLMLGGKSHPASLRGLYWVRALADLVASRSHPGPRSSFDIRGYELGSCCGLCWGSVVGGHAIVPRGLYWEWSGQWLHLGLCTSIPATLTYWSDVVVSPSGRSFSRRGLYWGYFDVISTRRPGTGGLDGWRIRPAPLSSSCTRAPGYTANAKAKIERKLFLKWSILA